MGCAAAQSWRRRSCAIYGLDRKSVSRTLRNDLKNERLVYRVVYQKNLDFKPQIIDLTPPEPRIRGWHRTGATGRAQLATKIRPPAAVDGKFGRLASTV